MLLGTIIIFSLNPMKISFGYDNNNLGAGEYHYIGTDENDEAPQDLDLLEICCSWSNELSDAVLTYAFVDVDGIDQSAKHAVEDAIEEWDSKIEELELEKVQQYPSASDIQITFESPSGIRAGGPLPQPARAAPKRASARRENMERLLFISAELLCESH
jgi:hypothetical protein